jgi:WD40 repeat protein/Ca2+-binding EF-hand superfamily protein
MGNLLFCQHNASRGTNIPPLLEETQIFALCKFFCFCSFGAHSVFIGTMNDVRELLKRFQTQIHGYAIVEAQFEMIISFKPEVVEHVDLELLFDILDNDHDGRIDGLELLGGLALCCHSSFEEKCRFCFELFDFNLNSLLSKKELVIMMMSSLCGMNLLTGGSEELEPDIDVFEALAEEAIRNGDKNSDGQVSYEEFVDWARSNRDLMSGLEALHRIALEAKEDVESDDSAPETDGYYSETDCYDDDFFDNPLKPQIGDQALAIIPWLGQIQEPTNYRPRKDINSGPKTNLELIRTFGYNCRSHPNNIKYLFHSKFSDETFIVYPSAAVTIIYDLKSKIQFFYLGHKSEITSIAIHPNSQIIATGDRNSSIHIWTLNDNKQAAPILIFSSMVKNGIQQMLFSPLGDRLVVIGGDVDHTICLHNSLNGDVIASGKGIPNPNNVHDIAFSKNGSELVMVGKNQIRFYQNLNTNQRSMEFKLGKIGNAGKRQNFFSATYITNDEVVVGCASGEIYKFKDTVCNSIIQAHGIKDPVYCLYYNANDGTLLSGGKDSMIKTWDATLKEIGTAIDLSEDLDGDGKPESGSLNSTVISVQQYRNRILIGTIGSDIYEASLPVAGVISSGLPSSSNYSLVRIASGHSKGELWGLDTHPTRDEFVTVGDDETIRIWSLRSFEQSNARKMPKGARSVCYNPAGTVLCVGMIDGEVSLVEATSVQLRAYSTWHHSNKMISDIKFSPDGNYLATASSDCNIYLYKSSDAKNFIRLAVCRGHSGAVTHIDFSLNSQFLQSNATDCSLLYWNLSGNQITHSFSMKDVTWATNTCVFGWSVQGIWNKKSPDYGEVNCCLALPDIGDIITGDDYNKINLYAYPSISLTSVYQSYSGHAAHVTNLKCSWNKRYLVSLGGLDRTVLLWRHDVEEEDSDDEEADEKTRNQIDLDETIEVSFAEENPTVVSRSLQQEAANLGWSVNDLKEHLVESEGPDSFSLPSGGDQSVEETPQWRSKIIEPTKWSSSLNSTDVDLELHWIFGHRCHDCRNNVLYSSDGSVVYNAANVAVLYHKPTGKQRFLLGPHSDEVISIAAHPAGQIFATGEAGRKGSIVVWNSKDMGVLKKLENVHENGVSLLNFNATGSILASVGLDVNNTLAIHDWNKDILIVSTSTNTEKVLCCCFLANDPVNLHNAIESGKSGSTAAKSRLTGKNTKRFSSSVDVSSTAVSFEGKDVVVTGGEKGFIKFWWWQGQNIQSQFAIWGNNSDLANGSDKTSAVLCAASTNSFVCVTGHANGNLLVWKNGKVCPIFCCCSFDLIFNFVFLLPFRSW